MQPNTLYFGDNLQVLREQFPDKSVDLVYLDPPFNSKRNYNFIYREIAGTSDTAQFEAFKDTWTMEGAAAEFREITESGFPEGTLIEALRQVHGDTSLVAYLSVMALRLRELHRVLKPTGSLWLHCDPTASHYLKMVLDCVFGTDCFRNEVVWHYRKWSAGKYTFQRNHDVLFFYTRSERNVHTFNQLFMPRAASTQKRFGDAKIVSGYDDSGRRLPSQTEDEPSEGVRMDDVWDIGRVPPVKQLFPTEKPLALLERIITASSNEGDLVLDPFCGCGTAVVAAQQLGRRWCGIDITSLAVTLIRERVSDHFPEVFPTPGDVPVDGLPKDVAGARMLFNSDPYDFQFWALTLVNAHPPGGTKKKGADKGIDGVILWHDGEEKLQRGIVSVKGGKVNDGMLRDLIGTMEHESAAMGLFVTLQPPSKPMRERAALAGEYELAGTNATFPRVQIWTIEELLSGRRPDLPRTSLIEAHKAAKEMKRGEQGELFDH